MQDSDLEDEEVPVLDRVCSSSTLECLTVLSWREQFVLSEGIAGRWHGIAIDDECPESIDDAERADMETRLQSFRVGEPLIDITSGENIFASIVRQLDPVWSVDFDTADSIYTSLHTGIFEIAFERMSPLRQWWMNIAPASERKWEEKIRRARSWDF